MMDVLRFSAFNQPQTVSRPSLPTLPQKAQQPLHRSSLSSLGKDIVQFGSTAEEPPSSEDLLNDAEHRAALINTFIGGFSNRETQRRLRHHLETNPSISGEPELYINALQQLAQSESNVGPQQAISRYSLRVHQLMEQEASTVVRNQRPISRRARNNDFQPFK